MIMQQILTVRERHCEIVGDEVFQEEERESKGSPQNSSILKLFFYLLFISLFAPLWNMKDEDRENMGSMQSFSILNNVESTFCLIKFSFVLDETRKLVEQSHSPCFNKVMLSQSDYSNCCVWRVCIETRLAERITGIELGWLVDSSPLLFGPYSITTLTRVWYGQGVGSQKVLLYSWFLSQAHRQTSLHSHC